MSVKDRISELEQMRKSKRNSLPECISALVEPDSFIETDSFYGDNTPGEGLITGSAVINDRAVFIYAHEHDVEGGCFSAQQADKLARLLDNAVKTGTPVVGVINSKGTRINDGLDAAAGYAKIIRAASRASGIVPHIIIVEGVTLGTMAAYTQYADATIAIKGASICISPATKTMVEVSAGQHTAAYIATDYKDAANYARTLLDYLPDNNAASFNLAATEDDPNRLCARLNDLAEDGYNVKDVISEIADNGKYIEMYGAFAEEMVTAFAFVDGQTVGVIANQYCINDGRITAAAALKGERFINLCNSYSIPVVFLADTDGFEISKQAEENGLAPAAARFMAAVAAASVPMITVILKRAIGGGYIAMGSLGLGADRAFAWAGAEIGLMVPASAVCLNPDLLQNANDPINDRKEIENAYALEHMDALVAAKAGYISEPIEPAYTRKHIIAAVSSFYGKREESLPRKNPVLPI